MASLSRKRVGAAFQRHGPGGLAGQIANRLVRLAFLDQHHVWYVLDLAERRDLPVPAGYALRKVNEQEDLGRWLIDILDDTAAERLAAGNQLWIVEHDGEPAFNCFIFFGRSPVRAASGRSLLLPPGTACLEDSVTAADHRGHGIAGAAWCAIAGELLGAGLEVLVTKVEVDNHPSRKAVEKAGFLPAAVMHLRRRGLVEHVAFDGEDTELTSAGAAARTALHERLVR